MSSSEFHERFRSNPLCDFRLGTVVTFDYETPLTGYEPNKDLNLVNTEELDLAATSDVYWQHTLDDDASLNDPNVDDNQLAKYLAVVVESTGKPVEMRSNNDQFSCDTRNLKSAQSQFPVVSQPEMICQTGGSVQARIAEEREIAQAQIRTMLDEQRRMRRLPLAYVTFAPHESAILLTVFAAACPASIIPGFSVYSRRQSCQSSSAGSCE